MTCSALAWCGNPKQVAYLVGGDELDHLWIKELDAAVRAAILNEQRHGTTVVQVQQAPNLADTAEHICFVRIALTGTVP